MKKIINILICLSLSMSLFGCSSEKPYEGEVHWRDDDKEEEVHESVTIAVPESFYVENDRTATEAANRRYREFAIKQLTASISEGENEIISPMSLYYVLAMLSNGAEGKTRQQLETVLGMSVDDLNHYLRRTEEVHVNDEWQSDFKKANGIWFNSDLGQLKEGFVQTIMEYYGDALYEGSFKDAKQITDAANSFVFRNTEGAINDLVKEEDIQKDTTFLLINALIGGERWSFAFDRANTRLEPFYGYDGQTTMVEMMHQTISGYWSADGTEGFAKQLNNGCWFMAFLPDENTDIYDYIALMDADSSRRLYDSRRDYDIIDTIDDGTGMCYTIDLHFTNLSFPKFTYDKEYDLDLTMKRMGLSDLFEAATSDFSNMSDGPLYVQKVKQKCSIEVDEEKAVATAATGMMGGKGAGGCDEVRDTIYHDLVFDRPFVFMITTDYGELPLFIGVVSELGEVMEGTLLENITGVINIRTAPSTSAEVAGKLQKGQQVIASESKEAEGYTWYKIGENRWVADQNGEWLRRVER